MKARIHQNDRMTAGIELNGVRVEDAVRGAVVTMAAGQLPQLELDPLVVDISIDLDDVQVYVSAAARHLLIMLGWTPPEVVADGSVPEQDQDRDEAGTARSDS